jgi:hypothetical protein
MPGPEHENSVTLDLGEEEEWVLHAALLEHLDQQAEGGDHGSEAVTLVDQLEADGELVLSDRELQLVQRVLSEYLAGAPLRDRAICRGVLTQVRKGL